MAKPKKKYQQHKPNPTQFKPFLDPAVVKEKLAELNGNQAAVARHLGVTRSAINKLIGRNADLRVVIQDARDSRIDTAESALDRAVLAGEGWAVKLILETLGKERGYTSKTEIEHSGKVDSQPTEIIVRTREEADALLGRKRKPASIEAADSANAEADES